MAKEVHKAFTVQKSADDCNSHRVLRMQNTICSVPNGLITLVVVLVIMLRSVALPGNPYLWAEDATIFLTRSVQSGIRALGQSYAGYYHVVPQGVTLLVVWLSKLVTGGMRIVPYMMYCFAVAWSAYVFLYFALGDFDWLIIGKWRRTCICLLTVLFIPMETGEVWFNVTNFQWWAEIFLFFVGLRMVHGWEMPKWKSVLPVLVFIGLSTPAGGLILLVAIVVCIVRWRRRIITKSDLLVLTAIAMPVVFQITAVLRQGEGRTLIRLGSVVVLFFKYFLSTLPQILFPNSSVLVGSWNQVFACTLFWGPLVYIFMCCKEIRPLIVYGVLYMFSAAGLFLLTATGGERTLTSGRYSFAIISVWLILIISGSFKIVGTETGAENDLRKRALPIVLALCICILPYRQLPLSVDLAGAWKSIEKYMSAEAGQQCWISVAPGWPWGVSVLIQTRYLQAEPSKDIIYAVDFLGDTGSTKALEEGISMNGQGGLSIAGWAMELMSPVTVLIEANGNYVATRPVNRKDVADYYQIATKDETFYSGYEAVIPADYLVQGENELKLVLISEASQRCNQIPLTVQIVDIR